MKGTAEERFWPKVKKSFLKDGCWPWQAGCDSKGYGSFSLIGRTIVGAHVASWIIYFGPIPKGMCVLHKCDNPPCVRPDHLFLGTKGDNIRDMDDKGRRGVVRGAQQWQAKLTEEIVIEARHRVKTESLTELAKEYGVGLPAMSMAVRGINWKHIPIGRD